MYRTAVAVLLIAVLLLPNAGAMEAVNGETDLLTLPEERGSLQVTIYPYGSRVEIDSEYRGETPLGISLPPGGYHMAVTHDGYEPLLMDITIYDGQTVSLETNLTPVRTPEPPETTVPPATEAAGWLAALALAGLLIGYRLRR